MTTEAALKLPVLSASIVENYTPEGQTEQRSHWTDVGTARGHKNGAGYTIYLRPGLSISGTVALRAPKQAAGEEATPIDSEIFSGPLTAYVIERYSIEGESEERTHWTDVGRAIPNRDGRGFQLHIRPCISLHGQVVLRTPKPKDQTFQ